jgi:hypothetical protein
VWINVGTKYGKISNIVPGYRYEAYNMQTDWLIDCMIVVKGQVGNISAIFMARKVFLVRKKVWTEV